MECYVPENVGVSGGMLRLKAEAPTTTCPVGVYWSAKEIRWYIDGVERRNAFKPPKDIVHKPMYFLADFAVGGDWPGPPDSITKFPTYFDIDYVRIWQQ